MQNICNDIQNSKFPSFQESLKKSINNLIAKKPLIAYNDIIEDMHINNFCKIKQIIDFSSDETVHTELNLNFKELLISVYNHIINNQYKKYILKILEKDIISAECIWLAGRINKLVSCLCMFENDISIDNTKFIE
jgi:hypothetical protein